ncbi:MAG: hypothetical protein U0234_21455 [Sandaracinus sp.]
MSPPLAFVLNLDAELELEAGRRYQPRAEVAARVLRLAREMRPTLPAGCVVIDPLGERAPPEAEALAWCPTPRALAAIARAGLAAPAAPGVEVLRRVNDRRFAAALDPGELAGAAVLESEEAAREALARPGEWLLKRVLGVSGRGQRRVRGGEPSEADLAFVRASLEKSGALVIEPRVVIERELSVHAWATALGPHVRSMRAQHVDAFGAFLGSRHADDLSPAIATELAGAAARVGAALREAGYAGPFGVDAYLHRGDGSAPLTLRSLSEINARFCMGWDEHDGWRPPA